MPLLRFCEQSCAVVLSSSVASAVGVVRQFVPSLVHGYHYRFVLRDFCIIFLFLFWSLPVRIKGFFANLVAVVQPGV